MKPTLRIAARPALSAGLATSAWRTQGGYQPCSLMQASAFNSTGLGNAPRHEIDTPIYREVAM